MNFIKKLFLAAMFALTLTAFNTNTYASEIVITYEFHDQIWWEVTYIDGVKADEVPDDIL